MPSLKELLKSKLTAKQFDLLRRSYDIVGDIAIVEIPLGLTSKKAVIADAILQTHHNVNSVYMEAGARVGTLRLQPLKWVGGAKGTETTVRENNVNIKLDLAKVYYSVRMSSERKRVYQQIKKPETVLVMFSGAGPYNLTIAKNTKAKKVVGIEINKIGHKYAVENANKNKVDNKLAFYRGDVRKILPKLNTKFERVIMPLPKGAHNYLDLALKYTKMGGTINYYDFLPEDDIPKVSTKHVRDAAAIAKKKS